MGTTLTLLSEHRDVKTGLSFVNIDRYLQVDCMDTGACLVLAGKYKIQEDIEVFMLSKDDALKIAKAITAYYSQY
jgi:hypothetical protein